MTVFIYVPAVKMVKGSTTTIFPETQENNFKDYDFTLGDDAKAL